ncbi:MAG: hypothetical protein V3V59_00215 [Thermodesulfovibrionales bacterium]
MRRHLLLILIMIMLTACASEIGMERSFSKSYNDYNRALGWSEFDKLSLYASTSRFDEFRARAKELKDVKILDVREIKLDFDEIKGVAKVEVEIDYYRLPSTLVKTQSYTQKWSYREESGMSRWYMMTLLPEFK